MKLLVIADDFTGALDTGVQFAAKGAATQVVVDSGIAFDERQIQVMVVDAETRHLTGEKAYSVVFGIVKNALAAGFTHIYKKTDSALRGNIGSELAAVLDAAGADRLTFLPAFPKMNRATRGGVHYIDNVPVADGVFGQDPFEPVTESSVEKIIRQGSDKAVVCHSLADPVCMQEPGVHVYDAETQEDLIRLGSTLGSGGLRLCAGCAGFGSVLAELLLPEGTAPELPELEPSLFVACGSVNPVTLHQMAVAENAGFHHIHLNPIQKLQASWVEGNEKQRAVENWLALAKSGSCILDVNDPPGCDDTVQYASRHGMTTEFMRQQIAANLAVLVKAMLDGGLTGTILCTGGDTLLALMKQVGVGQLTPVGELTPGAVLTRFRYRDRIYNIISKSGGFGAPDLFLQITKHKGKRSCLKNTI